MTIDLETDFSYLPARFVFDVLIQSEGKQNSLRARHLAISILECTGFKINYSKSIISHISHLKLLII